MRTVAKRHMRVGRLQVCISVHVVVERRWRRSRRPIRIETPWRGRHRGERRTSIVASVSRSRRDAWCRTRGRLRTISVGVGYESSDFIVRHGLRMSIGLLMLRLRQLRGRRGTMCSVACAAGRVHSLRLIRSACHARSRASLIQVSRSSSRGCHLRTRGGDGWVGHASEGRRYHAAAAATAHQMRRLRVARVARQRHLVDAELLSPNASGVWITFGVQNELLL